MSKPNLVVGENLITSFQGNRATYIREHILLAALGSLLMAGGLMVMGNPHAWTGVVGAVLAIGARGIYVANEQLGFVWHLTNRRLIGPGDRNIMLSQIAKVRHIFSAIQVVTESGDKHLIKYQGDVEAVKAAILTAAE
ncbi:MAG: hypothetical protein GY945_06635 [Rhodobacteraceae bacterium]|nr:hypothetical protein [Paracoccaceae bacterium]